MGSLANRSRRAPSRSHGRNPERARHTHRADLQARKRQCAVHRLPGTPSLGELAPRRDDATSDIGLRAACGQGVARSPARRRGPAPPPVRHVVPAAGVLPRSPLRGRRRSGVRFHPRQAEQPARVAERYCRHFDIAHRRTDLYALPPADAQETLADLVEHYDERGVEGMATGVFESTGRFPGTRRSRADTVLRIATALRGVGVEVLQDVQPRRVHQIEEALRGVPGMGESLCARC